MFKEGLAESGRFSPQPGYSIHAQIDLSCEPEESFLLLKSGSTESLSLRHRESKVFLVIKNSRFYDVVVF
jgi:hypothetical protein